jgi:hypothetical protein
MTKTDLLKELIEAETEALKERYVAYYDNQPIPRLNIDLLGKLFPDIPSKKFLSEYYGKRMYISKSNNWHQDYKMNHFEKDIAENIFESEHVHFSYSGSPVKNDESEAKINGNTILTKMKVETNLSFRIAPLFKYTSLPKILLEKVELLEGIFGAEVGLIAFFSKKQESVIPRHWDTEDLIVCQISGKKKWFFNENFFKHPLRQHKYGFDPSLCRLSEDETFEIELEPGDIMYLPKGLGHHAKASSEDSLHVTYGIYHPSSIDILENYLSSALQVLSLSAEARASLSCYDLASDTFKGSAHRFHEILNSFDSQNFLEIWAVQYRLFNLERFESVTKIPLGPMPKTLSRSHVRFKLTTENDLLIIHTYGRSFTVPSNYKILFQSLLKLENFSPDDVIEKYGQPASDYFLEIVRKLRLFT